MAIILYCRNGHDLGTHDSIRLGAHTGRQIIAMAERHRREALAPRQPFCTECGESTLDACQHCGGKIERRPRPAYCRQCGKPFPWTENALAAAREYLDLQDNLNDGEKAELKVAFDDLTRNTPRTQVAASRFKRIIRKLTPDAAETIRKTIVEIASETAVKLLKPGP